MSIDKWDPLREFLRLRNLFNEVFDRTFQSSVTGEEMGARGWSPVVDVYNNTHEIVVNAELPGIEEDKLQIAYHKNILTIKGERPASYNNGEVMVHRLERQHGLFQREVSVPRANVDHNRIRLSYKAGVLTVVLPIAQQNDAAIRIPIDG